MGGAHLRDASEHRVKYAVPKNNIGFQLLKKAGWKEGSGLGSEQQGRPVPLEAWHNKGKQGIGATGNVGETTGEKALAGAPESGAKRKTSEAATSNQPRPKTKDEKLITKKMKKALRREQAWRDSAVERHMREEFNEIEPTCQHNPLLNGNPRLSASNPLLDD